MAPKLKLFGTSGIRGVVNQEIFVTDFLKFGSTFSKMIGRGPIIVGHDVRESSIAFKYAFIAGAISNGTNVFDAGLVPTPALLFAIKKIGAKGGAMITGSHAIREVNGIMFFKDTTAEFNIDDEIQFEKLFSSIIKNMPTTQNNFGKLKKIDALRIYKREILKITKNMHLDLNKTIVVDPGNGCMSKILGDILEEIGFHIIRIHDYPNSRFPYRDPYPRRENLLKLASIVSKYKDAIGVATDGDGDRAVFVAENGEILPGDLIGAIFSRKLLESKTRAQGRIVCPVNTSMVINETVENHNCKVIYTKVGPPYIVDAMVRNNADFGFEETGKYIWPDLIYYGDSLVSTLKLLEILSEEKKSLSNIAAEYPKYTQIKKAVPCATELKENVLKQIKEFWEQYDAEQIELNLLDGIKIFFKKRGCWMLFRPSGTEPMFRIYVECKDKRDATELFKLGYSLLENILKQMMNRKQ